MADLYEPTDDGASSQVCTKRFFLNESPAAVVCSWRADVKQHHSYFMSQFVGEERLRSDKLFFWLTSGRASDCTKIVHCSSLSRRLSIFGHIDCTHGR